MSMLGFIASQLNQMLGKFDSAGFTKVEGEVSSILIKYTVYLDFNDRYDKAVQYFSDAIVKGDVIPVMKDGSIVGGVDSGDVSLSYSGDGYVYEFFDPHIPVIDIKTSLEDALPLVLDYSTTFSQRAIVTQDGFLVGSISLISFPNHKSYSNPQDSMLGGPDNPLM